MAVLTLKSTSPPSQGWRSKASSVHNISWLFANCLSKRACDCDWQAVWDAVPAWVRAWSYEDANSHHAGAGVPKGAGQWWWIKGVSRAQTRSSYQRVNVRCQNKKNGAVFVTADARQINIARRDERDPKALPCTCLPADSKYNSTTTQRRSDSSKLWVSRIPLASLRNRKHITGFQSSCQTSVLAVTQPLSTWHDEAWHDYVLQAFKYLSLHVRWNMVERTDSIGHWKGALYAARVLISYRQEAPD